MHCSNILVSEDMASNDDGLSGFDEAMRQRLAWT